MWTSNNRIVNQGKWRLKRYLGRWFCCTSLFFPNEETYELSSTHYIEQRYRFKICFKNQGISKNRLARQKKIIQKILPGCSTAVLSRLGVELGIYWERTRKANPRHLLIYRNTSNSYGLLVSPNYWASNFAHYLLNHVLYLLKIVLLDPSPS